MMEYEIKHVLHITDGEYKGYKEILFVSKKFVLDRVYVLLDPNHHGTHFFSHGRAPDTLKKKKEEIDEIIHAKRFRLQTIFSKNEKAKHLMHFKCVQELPKILEQKIKIVCIKERLGIYGNIPNHEYKLFICSDNNKKENISSWFISEYISVTGSCIQGDIVFPEKLRSQGYNITVVDHEKDMEKAFQL